MDAPPAAGADDARIEALPLNIMPFLSAHLQYYGGSPLNLHFRMLTDALLIHEPGRRVQTPRIEVL